eukprot:363680-Chlamydomonas_euryale.AAC.6
MALWVLQKSCLPISCSTAWTDGWTEGGREGGREGRTDGQMHAFDPCQVLSNARLGVCAKKNLRMHACASLDAGYRHALHRCCAYNPAFQQLHT